MQAWARQRYEPLSESNSQSVPTVIARDSLRDPASVSKHGIGRDTVGTLNIYRDPAAAVQGSWATQSDEDESAATSSDSARSITSSDLGTLRGARRAMKESVGGALHR